MSERATERLRRPLLLFGATGQVGRELGPALHSLGTVIAPPHADADLSRPDSLRDVIASLKPSVIINTAALTNVDRAEREPDLAFALNDVAPGTMADAARAVGAVFVHYSTDYVFGAGTRATPYTEDDEPSPINVYGASKLAGERSVAASGSAYLVLRTSWVYSKNGAGFVPTMLRQLCEPGDLRVVADQTGSPTWSRALARATVNLLHGLIHNGEAHLPDESRGVYHLGGAGAASRVEIAEEIMTALGAADRNVTLDPKAIVPIPASEFGAVAPRPRYSALSIDRIERVFGVRLDHWKRDLRSMLTDA